MDIFLNRLIPFYSPVNVTQCAVLPHDIEMIDRIVTKDYCNVCSPYAVKAKFHYAILVADRSEANCRPAASWNLAYHHHHHHQAKYLEWPK